MVPPTAPLLALLLLLLPLAHAFTSFGSCAIQGGDWAGPVPAYQGDGTTPIVECTPNATACDGEADIVFVMDGSGSVDGTDYLEATTFLAKLAMSFAIGDDLVKVSFVQYSAGGTAGTPAYIPEGASIDSMGDTFDAPVAEVFTLQELESDPNQICASLAAAQIGAG